MPGGRCCREVERGRQKGRQVRVMPEGSLVKVIVNVRRRKNCMRTVVAQQPCCRCVAVFMGSHEAANVCRSLLPVCTGGAPHARVVRSVQEPTRWGQVGRRQGPCVFCQVGVGSKWEVSVPVCLLSCLSLSCLSSLSQNAYATMPCHVFFTLNNAWRVRVCKWG